MLLQMKTVKMKTGTVLDEPTINMKTFILVFMAIIWRRVMITSLIYCDHNKIKINQDVILKSLKYNIFSEAGIGHSLKPYIVKALKDGFLMPRFYTKNIYASRAIKLFIPAYEIVKEGNKFKELLFIKSYALYVADKISTEEKYDVTKDIELPTTQFKDIIGIGKKKCGCKLCELVDSWDIQTELIYSEDKYQNVIMKGLMIAMNS